MHDGSRERVANAGNLLAQAWLDGRQIDSLPPELMPCDIVQATAIQDAMAARIGEQQEVVGWKVGGSPGPMVGRVFDANVFHSPADLPAAHFPPTSMECEYGFRILEDLPSRANDYSNKEVVERAILVLTIELTGSRLLNGKLSPDSDEDVPLMVADNAVQAGLIVGPEIGDWLALSLLDVEVRAHIEGGPKIPMQRREDRTNPVDVLVWLANELSARGHGLMTDQIVSTGSATVPQPILPGSRAKAVYKDLGEIHLRLFP